MPKVIILIFKILLILILLLFTVSFIANILFTQKVEKEVQEFFASNIKDNNKEIIKQGDLEGLPAPVQRWLKYSQVIGKERINSVRSKQKAVMRLKADQAWMPLEAEQYFTVDEPGFIWKAKVKAAPLIHIMGRDKYHEGKGNMLIKVMSLITVADGKGKEMDQGSLVRYLAETVWLPTAALSDFIKWEEIDSKSAKATMSYRGVTASGVFNFNDKGEVTNFEAQRYGDFQGEYRLETWSIPVSDYKEFDGVRVPTKGEVTWKLKTGDYNWYNFEVTDVEYNKPVMY